MFRKPGSIFIVLVLSGLTLCFTGCTKQEANEQTQPAGVVEPAGDVITLTYANFPPAPTFPCVQMEKWKEEVEARTEGKVKVQTFPGGTLLGAKNIIDGVIAGTADIGCFAMSYHPGRFPVSEAADLPIGFPSSKVASLTLYDLIETYQPAEFQDVKILTLFTCPPCNIMSSQPISTLADLQGKELRCSGTGVEIMQRLGASPIAMPMSDTPDALQKGVVKGIVSSMEILQDFNFIAYCPYATQIDLFVVSFAVVMNKDKWDALPDDVKKIVEDFAREHSEWTGAYVDQHTTEALTWSKENHNHQIFQLPAEDAEKIPGLMQPIIDSYIEKANAAGLPGEKLVADVKALRQQYSQLQ